MTHPYESLPSSAFWRSAVAQHSPFEIEELWTPRFAISKRVRIATAGSCFAQHFSRALVARGYRWQNFEPGPSFLSPAQAHDFQYGTFSFRTGNIYTARILRQWVEWAFGVRKPPKELWMKDGRYFDPFRPSVEPGGYYSPQEAYDARNQTLAAIKQAITKSNVFVFTMGLTESWQNKTNDLEYAICPETLAGKFDPDVHKFVNHTASSVGRDMLGAIKIMRQHNPKLKILLTISPVPLTATASGKHALLATSHSKAILRCVAGELQDQLDFVDYFPSYEIITSPAYRGMFFAPNMRSVTQAGVDFVMQNFFRDQERLFPATTTEGAKAAPNKPAEIADNVVDADADVHCEEEMLAAFGK